MTINTARLFRRHLPVSILIKAFDHALKLGLVDSILILAYELFMRGIYFDIETTSRLLSLSTKYYPELFDYMISSLIEPRIFLQRINTLRLLNGKAIEALFCNLASRNPLEALSILVFLLDNNVNWISYDALIECLMKKCRINLARLLDNKNFLRIIFKLNPSSLIVLKLLRQATSEEVKFVQNVIKLLHRRIKLSTAIKWLEKRDLLSFKSLANQLAFWFNSFLNRIEGDTKSVSIFLRYAGCNLSSILNKLEKTSSPNYSHGWRKTNLRTYVNLIMDNAISSRRRCDIPRFKDKNRKHILETLYKFAYGFYRGKINYITKYLNNVLLNDELLNTFISYSKRYVTVFSDKVILSLLYLIPYLPENTLMQFSSIMADKPFDPIIYERVKRKLRGIERPNEDVLLRILEIQLPKWLRALLLNFLPLKRLTKKHIIDAWPWILLNNNSLRLLRYTDFDALTALLRKPIIIAFLIKRKKILLKRLIEYIGSSLNHSWLALLKALIAGEARFQSKSVLNNMFKNLSEYKILLPYLPKILKYSEIKLLLHFIISQKSHEHIASYRLRRYLDEEIIRKRISYLHYISEVLASPFLSIRYFKLFMRETLQEIPTRHAKALAFLVGRGIIENSGIRGIRKLLCALEILPEEHRDSMILSLYQSTYVVPIQYIEKLVQLGGNNKQYYCLLQKIIILSHLYG